ncbi:ABC transporter permease [Jidongwangia harbinensis]|uniref:ABC transporter permease n=1 Tax=Jidongwangia harbinensis TaxID=2878561 RepID=UPI001CDA506A|nr:ABC transporter permease [Jidongwangia harbinensis]MCA2215248.1 ABC transporter permease [Jidongwangia harbinensis]
MSRALRIDLRRSPAVAVGLLVLAFGLAGMYLLSGAEWAGRWTAMALTVRLYLGFMWPVTLAGGCWLTGRDRRGRVGELFASTARPGWQRVLSPATALTIATSGGYLLVIAACVPLVADTATYFHPAVVGILAVGLLSLLAAGLLGMAAGRLLPSRLTAPTLAVLGLMYVVSISFVNYFDAERMQSTVLLLTPQLNTMFQDFVIVPSRFTAGQALWFAALAGAGFLLLAARGRRARAAAVVLPLVAAAVAVPLLPRSEGLHAAARLDPGATALVCAPGTPRVCVRRAHAVLLPEVVPLGRQALARLAVLPDPPTSVVEAVSYPGSPLGTERPGPDEVSFSAYLDRERRLADPGSLLLELLAGGGAPACVRMSDDDYAARQAAGYWLAGQAPADADEGAETWRALTALPADEQARRVGDLRRAALRCAPDLTAVLVGRRG